jgi:hypothetical protein
MFTNQKLAPTNVSQTEPPARQRNPASPDRRPTVLGNNASKGGNLFGGWGPRLG